MPYFYETPRSRKSKRDANGQSVTRSWFCSGTADLSEVYELAYLFNPLVFQGLTRKTITCDPLNADTWAVEVEYGTGALDGTGLTPDVYSFKISAGTVHITQSKETLYRRQASDGAGAGVGTAPDYQGAIGVSDSGVGGCDITAPAMQWSKSVQRAELTFAYLRTVRNMVGRTNNAEFYEFPAGTLLYLGCEPTSSRGTLPDGSGSTFTIWNLTHSFAQEENQIQIDIGTAGIVLPAKGGHDYVWVEYEQDFDSPNSKLTSIPVAAYVERVYEPGNFALLEIGE